MGEETPGLENLFVLEESRLLGPRSTGLVQAPAWLMTLMQTAMAQVAMNPMDMSPGAHRNGVLTVHLLAMARTRLCWRPRRAARGVCVCARACVYVCAGVPL